MNMMTMTRQTQAGSAFYNAKESKPPLWRWQQHSFRAMNTGVYVCRYGRDDKDIKDVEKLFSHYEHLLSRFNPDAELAQLNRSNLERQPVSETLFDALAISLQAAYATGGLYDPTILRVLEQTGYDRSFERIIEEVSDEQPQMNMRSENHYSFRDIRLDAQTHEIWKPVGLKLDLGGMGKGWTVDRTADSLNGEGPFLINAGGDLYAYGTPHSIEGWRIDLEHPFDSSRTLASVSLRDQALATSTTARRRWQRNGKTMNHLIDPRTNEPASTDALSVSVVAPRTVLAEIYAKVALILGAEQGLAYLQSLPDVDGMIYTQDERMLFTDAFYSILI